jgi:hypothetical protein
MEQVVAGYIKARDKKKIIKERHSEELAPLNKAMATLEAWMLNNLQQDQHAQSVKTKQGTVYLSTLLKPKVEDRNTFLDYLREANLLHMLDVKPNVPAMEDYLEEHDHPPPGISIRRETFARVRK